MHNILSTLSQLSAIVVRVVTIMPSSASGIELSFAAWQALGYPPCNAGNVTIALMAEP